MQKSQDFVSRLGLVLLKPKNPDPKTPKQFCPIADGIRQRAPARVGRSSRGFASVLIRHSLRSALRATGSLKTRQNPSRTGRPWLEHVDEFRLLSDKTVLGFWGSGFLGLRSTRPNLDSKSWLFCKIESKYLLE